MRWRFYHFPETLASTFDVKNVNWRDDDVGSVGDGCGTQGQTVVEVALLLKVIAFLHLQSSCYPGPRTPRSVELREYKVHKGITL